MLFDPSDPFPAPLEGMNYAQAQAHAAEVDAWLGLRVDAVEAGIERSKDHQLWAGLKPQSLLTPYTEIREVLERLQPASGATLVDLGAAYGRIGFVMNRHFPNTKFIGYELVKARVDEGCRCFGERFGGINKDHFLLLCIDLGREDFRPASADFYFLYDFGTRRAIEKVLGDLQLIARDREIVVVGRGRASRDALERGQPWLSQVKAPEHYPHYSIYRS